MQHLNGHSSTADAAFISCHLFTTLIIIETGLLFFSMLFNNHKDYF